VPSRKGAQVACSNPETSAEFLALIIRRGEPSRRSGATRVVYGNRDRIALQKLSFAPTAVVDEGWLMKVGKVHLMCCWGRRRELERHTSTVAGIAAFTQHSVRETIMEFSISLARALNSGPARTRPVCRVRVRQAVAGSSLGRSF